MKRAYGEKLNFSKGKKAVAGLLFLFVTAIFALSFAGCSPLAPREKVVYYSEFGAVGDGKTDDFQAIYDAHKYANENGIAVAADKGRTYYIGCGEDEAKTHEKSAIVKTNTYWQDARFIIDDKAMTSNKIKNADLFVVKSDTDEEKLTVPEGYSLKAGQKNIGMKFDGPRLIYIVNKNKKDFIRSGVDQNNGSDRQEVILVNKNGRVDKSTPVTWDYDEVTSMTAISVSDKPITLSGGDFTTVETAKYLSYVNRGILVTRSNVTVKNVKHTVVDETKDGSSYSGFYRAQKAHNVLFEKCVMWGRFTPVRSNGLTQGTYDISAKLANKVTWKKCTQGNDLKDGWGVMGSNHSRNLSMIGCSLSRFDAHQGVYNATIKNCTIRDISVVGFGKLRIENVTKNAVKDADYGEAEFMGLRADYGAFWRGDIIIKNCTVYSNAAINYLIKINHKYDWDYGYTCSMPTSVTVDNVNVIYSGGRSKPYPYFYVFSNLDLSRQLTPEILAGLDNPYVLCKKVIVKNCDTDYFLTHNKTGLLDKTKYIVNGKRIKPEADKAA